MYVLLGDPGYPGLPGESGQKGNHNTLGWCHCYIVSLGVKGDTGEPGVRGRRGLVGKMHLYLFTNRILAKEKQQPCDYNHAVNNHSWYQNANQAHGIMLSWTYTISFLEIFIILPCHMNSKNLHT